MTYWNRYILRHTLLLTAWLVSANAMAEVRINGNVFGGGNLASVDGNTEVKMAGGNVAKSVYGGGKGKADTFTCEKAMVGTADAGYDDGQNKVNDSYTDGNTTVVIGNGTVEGNVYGGGMIGRVEMNTTVTIGSAELVGSGTTSAPVIGGNVYGAGQGVETHGYSGLARGDATVTVQCSAWVKGSIYGGGEKASVGRYRIATTDALATEHGVEVGMPYDLKSGGISTVTIKGNAEVGPDGMTMPTFSGNVFGGCMGILPSVYSYADNDHKPKRMYRETLVGGGYEDKYEYFSNDDAYILFIKTLALTNETHVNIEGSAFVKGSVYGGSENGYVREHTNVTIAGGQIGCGEGETEPYSDWTATSLPECPHWTYGQKTGTSRFAPYDKFAKDDGTYDYSGDNEVIPALERVTSSAGGRPIGDDGHTYYGNVFGGGSGKDPYKPGKWLMTAGGVGGNTNVTISGGHILTNVYGGNELTNVGEALVNDESKNKGKCTITMTSGSIGVPRTLSEIAAHPLTCYLFGAGKGDQRVLFNEWTNVNDVVVSITGGTIYGSVFGGGEDGHIMRDVQMTIGNDDGTGPTIGTFGTSYVDGNVFGGGRGFGGDAYSAGNVGGSVKMEIKGGTMLGSIYGGGRLGSVGYGLYAVGNAGYGLLRKDNYQDDGTEVTYFNQRGRGNIEIDISGGIIGNDYEYLLPTATNIAAAGISETDISKWTAANWTTWKTHHNVPNTEYDSDGKLLHTKGGNVFTGGMGRREDLNGNPIIFDSSDPASINWHKLGNVKSTKVTVSGTAWIKSNVYGGGEFGAVRSYYVGDLSNPSNTEGGNTDVNITGGTIGTLMGPSLSAGGTNDLEELSSMSNADHDKCYCFGSVYGGGYGTEKDITEANKYTRDMEIYAALIIGDTHVSMTSGTVLGSVYGGGEVACVGGSTTVEVKGDSEVGVNEVRKNPTASGKQNYVLFGSWRMGNVYGGGRGSEKAFMAGLVLGNATVNISGTAGIYHNVYGGGAIGSVGLFNLAADDKTASATVLGGTPVTRVNGGLAKVTITGTPTIGINGWDNGMVNGSSRGDVTKPVIPTGYAKAFDIYDRLGWVNNTEVTIGTIDDDTAGPTIKGTVYGGGENGHNLGYAHVTVNSGRIGYVGYNSATDDYECGNVYGAGCGTDTYTGDDGKDHNNPKAGVVYGDTEVTIAGGNVGHNVFGGGSMGSVGGNVDIVMTNGRVYGSIYGGCANAKTNFNNASNPFTASETLTSTTTYKTNVKLLGGTIDGYAFGGGLGSADIPAYVYGDIQLDFNGLAEVGAYSSILEKATGKNYYNVKTGTTGCKVSRIFGCNNVNGTPKGDVTVNVWATQNKDALKTHIENKFAKEQNNSAYYDVQAVYGGGNEATYSPLTGKVPTVNIRNCDLTSIEYVYGGGNAAAVPETHVNIYGAYEIYNVFGGGNGRDALSDGSPNPGADVVGSTNTKLKGGRVHEAFGGSNTLGNIGGSINIASDSEGSECTLENDKIVSAGKNADINGDVNVVLGCVDSHIAEFYAGADQANVNGHVNVTITSGSFGKFFGGNNLSGIIKGYIKLNVEETGCTPITIDELYLGGNKAAYSKYGYYIETTANEGENAVGAPGEDAVLTADGQLSFLPRTSASDPHKAVKTYNRADNTWTVYDDAPTYTDPQLNIISCTRIGQVFGGGLGATASMYADPTVNINMIPGIFADDIDRDGNGTADGDATLLGEIGDVFGGGNLAAVYGSTTVNIGSETSVQMTSVKDNNDELISPQPTRTVTGAYVTGDVFGGGNLADVGKYSEVDDAVVEGRKNYRVDIAGSTNVNIGAKLNTTTNKWESVPEGTAGVVIAGNVYGGGNGSDATFECKEAMVLGNAGLSQGGGTNVRIGNGTIRRVVRGDGTVTGNVYGGGKIARVENNTAVAIGFGAGVPGTPTTNKPVIEGSVFGAGAGLRTHGYSALVRGNSALTIEGNAKVMQSVFGGGELATVGRYNVVAGVAESNISGGACTVTIGGYAEIGPDDMAMYHTNANGDLIADNVPDDYGHVFGAGEGILPYVGWSDSEQPWSKLPEPDDKAEYPAYNSLDEDKTLDAAYVKYIKTLALVTKTNVTIKDYAFVKGGVYGGSENGFVQTNTHVTIQDNCQIGNGYVQMKDDGTYLTTGMRGVNRRYTDAEWEAGHLITTNDASDFQALIANTCPASLPECASWKYGKAANAADRYAPYDKFANQTGDLGKYADGTSTECGRYVGDDGHTFFGNVFGGGSGYYPYRPGKWFKDAGAVYGNTYLTIKGGHILSNVYGGNEMTDVGKYDGNDQLKLTSGGTCYITMIGGTLGVPRTLKQIAAHPLTCYLFGAGKGDQRVFFNKSTNIGNAVIHISDDARIYGSVFGGGEDGHVLKNVTMNIGSSELPAEVSSKPELSGVLPTGTKTVSGVTYPYIGNWGTSYVEGNVFGGGRGFAADAYTAGNVAGTVTMNVLGGTMLGSIYGGGRLGSVGYGLFSAGVTGYGEMQKDNKMESYSGTINNVADFPRGYVYMTIGDDEGNGPTIGNTSEFKDYTFNVDIEGKSAGEINAARDAALQTKKNADNIPNTEFNLDSIQTGNTRTYHARVSHTKGGNVFAGGMGRLYKLDGTSYIDDVDWWKLGCVKSTTLTIKGGTIRGNVYGGGELGQVVGTHVVKDSEGNTVYTDANNTIAKVTGTEVTIKGSTTTIGTEVEGGGSVQYTFGSVFAGGYGSLVDHITVNGVTSKPKFIAGLVKEDTKLDMQNGAVKASIYGGGEMASVEGSTDVTVSNGTIGIEPITVDDKKRYFGAAKMGNVYGGGSGHNNTVRSGLIKKNSNVTISGGIIYHNVYGGGAFGTVGEFNYTEDPNENNKVIGVNSLKTDSTGVARVTITGGIIGYDGKDNGMVFGSSRGDINKPGKRDDHTAWVYDTHVTIGNANGSGPHIMGSLYGSGENGHVFNDAVVTVNGGTIGIYDSNDDGYTVTSGDNTYSGAAYPYRGNVYGAGCGTDKYYSGDIPDGHTSNDGEGDSFNPLAGIVYGNTTVNIKGGTVVRNVYGAGSMGSVDGNSSVTVTGGRIGIDGNDNGNVCGGPKGSTGDNINIKAHTAGNSTVTVAYATTPSADNAAKTEKLISGSVFGGGEAGIVKGSVTVDMNKGLVLHDMYGGGALAGTNTDNWDDEKYTEVTGLIADETPVTGYYTESAGVYTLITADDAKAASGTTYYSKGYWADGKTSASNTTTVNLHGGKIGGTVFGGALGQVYKAAEAAVYFTQTEIDNAQEGDPAYGKTTSDIKTPAQPEQKAIAPYVYGDVLVKLNENNGCADEANPSQTKPDTDNCQVLKIHGCNNNNGTPKGKVKVHVYKTVAYDDDHKKPTTVENEQTVYSKENTTYDMDAVYGGGNMAAYEPTDNDNGKTEVIIDGCDKTSIKTVYGGGNAAPVPATEVTVNGTFEIGTLFAGGNGKDNLPNGDPNPGANVGYHTYPDGTDLAGREAYAYGSGVAYAYLKGGTIYSAFGGSNTKGNVRTSSTVNLNEEPGNDCPLAIDEVYGAGNNAAQDGKAEIIMGCISYLKELYGGAKNADVNADVVLNVVSGRFERVFGGNNLGGCIRGSITVNVEETGCHPIIIGQLYGGGNQAGYSVYGYKEVSGVMKPRESATDGDAVAGTPYADPVMNVKSFTSIGEIFGGGFGEPAVMVGNPHVYIDECVGDNASVETETKDGKTVSINTGKTITINKGTPYQISLEQPLHEAGKIGAIGNVYGGGNAAKIIGNTNVLVGTRIGTSLPLISKPILSGGDPVLDEHGKPTYEMVTPIGADIRGNVFGGGNNAEVTGNTNVQIGRKVE